jgi:thioredoxin-like negative regulator of GroEL
MAAALGNSSELEAWLQASPAAVVYFESPGCGVCTVLRPQLEALIASDFPKLAWAVVDAARAPDAAAQRGLFTFPAVLVFFDGREYLRRVRNFSLGELARELERPYRLWLDGQAT